MIRSTFAGFNMASLALGASQRALDVTGQNLSNINTQGYTRQRLDQVSLNPVGPSISSSQYDSKVGQGVMMTGVSQIRDPFLDIQYRNQLPKVGTADAMDAILTQIGQIFDETDNDAIAVQLNKIISALQNLGDPENTGTDSADMVVRSACEVLLNTIHQNGSKVQEVYDELKTKLDQTVVPQVNSYLQQIVDLNISIRNTQILGNPGLELQDSRNELIDSLATYFPIEVQYEKKNMGGGIYVDLLNIDLRLADGTKIRIVEDDECGQIGIAKKLVDGKEQIVEPVELYVTEAGENPKTYGGGESVMPEALQKEIQGYIDDIASLNDSIKNNMAQLAQMKSDLQTAKNTSADASETAINSCMTNIASLNKQIADAQAAQPQDAKAIAKLRKQRTEAVDKLKTYFPEGKLAVTGGGTSITITDGTSTTHTLVQGDQAGSVSINKNATSGNVEEPVTFNLTSATGGTTYNNIPAGSAVDKAMTNATAEIEEEIAAKERRLELLKKQREEKINGVDGVGGLQSYFPAGTITATPNSPDDGIVSVKAGNQTLIAADNTKSAVSVTPRNDGSVTLNVAADEKALEKLTAANQNVEDIVKLNAAIKSNNEKIEAIEQQATNTGADSAVKNINSYIDTLAGLNKQIKEAEAAGTASSDKATELETQIDAKLLELKPYYTKIADLENDIAAEQQKNPPDETKIADLKKQLEEQQAEAEPLQKELEGLETQFLEKTTEAQTNANKVAELKDQRTETVDKLKTYFPDGDLKLDDATGAVSVEGTAKATSVLVDADGNKGSVAVTKDTDKNVTEPPTLEITGVGEPTASITTAVGKSVTSAIDTAKKDAETEINNILAENVELDKQRDKALETLKDSGYLADVEGTKTPNDPNGMLTVTAGNGADKKDLIDADNKASAIDSTGASSGEVSGVSITIPEKVANRSKVSINDNLDEGVLKGDLDMLNKAEIFDKDIANNVSATDTKGIQYYQNMLDTFVNQFATEMNRLNAITEEVPVVDASGNPVYETDAEGNIVMEPVLDKDGNPVMEQKLKDDGTGNMVPDTTTVKQTKQVPKLEKTQIIGWEGDKPIYEFKQVLDENGNPVMEDARDADGKLILEDVEVPVMQPKMQPKQKTETKVTEQPLFETTDKSTTFTASNIKVSDKWMSNEIKINVQRDPQGEGNSSDNWNVERMIHALSDQKFDFVDPQSGKVFSGTLYECYTSIQRIQSVERQATSQILDTHTQVLDQIADSKDSVSGVWMDEEVMSLMKYSQSYNAASRLMTVMDEVLERLITQTGACGR